MGNNTQTPFICDRIMKKALVNTAKRMNTSQSKVIQIALSQFLQSAISEELKKREEVPEKETTQGEGLNNNHERKLNNS